MDYHDEPQKWTCEKEIEKTNMQKKPGFAPDHGSGRHVKTYPSPPPARTHPSRPSHDVAAQSRAISLLSCSQRFS